MLYALAVGAGSADPLDELEYTTENSRGITLRAIPSMPCVLTMRVRYPSYGTFARHSILHAGQNMTFHRPFPTAGTANVVTSVVDMRPARDAALVTIGARFLTEDNEPLVDVESVILIRGESLPQDTSAPRDVPIDRPDREPDVTVMHQTQVNQALLYRLLGDRNPLHSDPQFAIKAGQGRPILHGLCTLGHAVRALLKATDGQSDNWARLSVRFSAPVLPGDQLTTLIWRQEDRLIFETQAGNTTVLKSGQIMLR